MEFSLAHDINDNHARTIIHIDMDCFYAQVEMLKDPSLRDKPLGIKQKNIVVTCNYPAREYGITKCMLIEDAQRLCSNLSLVNGEDLHDYRQTSYKVTNYLQRFTSQVERLGLDENYLDVSDLVKERIQTNHYRDLSWDGHVYESVNNNCDCGCDERIKIGSRIAAEIRAGLTEHLGLTSCAGIAHNKLLAKIVGSKHKPTQQTLLFPSNGISLILSLPSVNAIPGVGQNTLNLLAQKLNIKSVQDLQLCSLKALQEIFGTEKGRWILDVSFGIDSSPVKTSGKPLSIGLEDSCKSIKAQTEVREKLSQLLGRLVLLVKEDGRIPRTIKLTVRKFNNDTKTAHRETRQCNIPNGLFTVRGTIQLLPTSEEKLMTVIMRLFAKVIDIKRRYHVTLLGLSFTKFQEKATGKKSVASFLMSNVAVQSVLSLENNAADVMDSSSSSFRQQDFSTDGSESEIEPSPKKAKKLGPLIAKRRCFKDMMDCGSPSKLRVSELRLSSRESEIICPSDVDESVFLELPLDVQHELSQQWKREQPQTSCTAQAKKQKTNTLYNYFLKNCDQL